MKDLSAEELPPLCRTEGSGCPWLWRFGPGGPFDSDPRLHVLVPFDIRGPLEVEALRQSVETLVRRHEILRTTFARYDERPMAVVMPPARVPLPVDDLRAVANQRARLSEIIESELHDHIISVAGRYFVCVCCGSETSTTSSYD